MWRIDFPQTQACFECGQPLDLVEACCIVCGDLFCSKHLSIREGFGNCAACEPERRRREIAIPSAAVDRIIGLLQHDLDRTIAPRHAPIAEDAARRIRQFCDDIDSFQDRVVDDVQQSLHDMFIDTTWPKCPDHPNHPLWHVSGWWTCQTSGRRVARLGDL